MPDEQEDEVEKFREFLDHVTPEDFERLTSRLTLNLRLRVATRRPDDADPRSGDRRLVEPTVRMSSLQLHRRSRPE